MILDISNTFAQIDILDKNGEKIIAKIRYLLADILLDTDKDKHEDFIICYGKEKLFYVKILKVLHSILATSILHCKKFRKDIKVIECKVNPHSLHIANKIINGK
jgi:hypothetical protein